MIKDTIALLGRRGTDKVTGCEGVISSVCFDLYGCVQVALTPPAKENKVDHGSWFDAARVTVTKGPPVMEAPDFDALAAKPADYGHGPSDKAPPRA